MPLRTYSRAATAALVVLVPLLSVYAMTAFVLWETSPAAWSESARFFASLFGLMAAGIATAAHRGLA